MLSALRTLLAARPAATHTPAPTARLGLEAFDERLVPSVTTSNGAIVIAGTAGSDSVSVAEGYNNDYVVTFNGRSTSVPKKAAWGGAVRFSGGHGNDYFSFATSSIPLRLEANGGSGRDEIWGGRMNDVIYGGPDADRLYGGDGHDTVHGDGGNDTLYGGAGSDTLHGWDGDDTLYGDGGKDYLYGGFGVDTFYVYNDTDSVYDSGGKNNLYKNGRWWKV